MDFHTLIDGWKELESDPGLFTLLLEDMGVRGVEVEEIYDLHKPFNDDPETGERQHVYGFIFLFRWTQESRRESRATSRAVNRNNPPATETTEDAEKMNRMFFAQQIVPNSCATHALISVLLNCSSIDLGETLMELKDHTFLMSPENKGYAISNCSKLAVAHNRHASRHVDTDTLEATSGSSIGSSRFGRIDPLAAADGSKSLAQFHFVSYVPIDGHLYELDGLKATPYDHGPWSTDEEWTDLFRRVLLPRIKNDVDIRYSLMAVVPDRRLALIKKLQALKVNRNVIFEALKKIVTDFRLPSPFEHHNYFQSSASIISCEDGRPSPSSEKTKANILLDECAHLQDPSSKNINQQLESELDQAGLQRSLKSSPPNSLSVRSPAPSSSSTDTCSEVGSRYNDPQEGQCCSPDDILTEGDIPISKLCIFRIPNKRIPENPSKLFETVEETSEQLHQVPETHEITVTTEFRPSQNSSPSSPPPRSASRSPILKDSSQQMAAPTTTTTTTTNRPHSRTVHQDEVRGSARDLIGLLTSLEGRIRTCETHLNNELEKRSKYRLDDERRTFCYDQFFHDFIELLSQKNLLNTSESN